MGDELIRTVSLTKVYGSGENAVRALDGVNLSVQAGAVSARPGEMATPGQALLTLGDTSRMHVETTDLRETDVGRLKMGMTVEVTFDALPGRTFQGTIRQIAPMSSAEKGSTNYTVTVDVAGLDPSLRWGMTAFVNIQTMDD